MTKTYIVYDTHNNGVIYARGSAVDMAKYLGIATSSFWRNVNDERLVGKRFKIIRVEGNMKITVKEYLAREVEIWRCIKESESVCIGLRWNLTLFSTELQALLKTATITKGVNANLYDWRPKLKGCSQLTRPYDKYNLDTLIKECSQKTKGERK